MVSTLTGERRYFLTYTGMKLPFRLSQPLAEADIINRNTYFIGYFDTEERMLGLEKIVYGEIEFSHHYHYDKQGKLLQADIVDAENAISSLTF
jgi:Family of unknown function (DUF6156)